MKIELTGYDIYLVIKLLVEELERLENCRGYNLEHPGENPREYDREIYNLRGLLEKFGGEEVFAYDEAPEPMP